MFVVESSVQFSFIIYFKLQNSFLSVGLVWTKMYICLLNMKLFFMKTTLCMLYYYSERRSKRDKLYLLWNGKKEARVSFKMILSLIQQTSQQLPEAESSCSWLWPSRCRARSAWLVTVSVTHRVTHCVTPGLSWTLAAEQRHRTTTSVPSHPSIKQLKWRSDHGVNILNRLWDMMVLWLWYEMTWII